MQLKFNGSWSRSGSFVERMLRADMFIKEIKKM